MKTSTNMKLNYTRVQYFSVCIFGLPYHEHPARAAIELFCQCCFVLWLELQAALIAAEKQISSGRRIQEKEILVINQAYVVWK